ncbi:MAG: hypothetical protein QHI48_00545 [Bacteroidota bacterium]|nr:hypothetical protein [Bacteroidota bacterium]
MVSSYIFSDNRALALNKQSSNKFLAGVRWNIADMFTIQPLAGYAFDSQQDHFDEGFMYAVDALLSPINVGVTRFTADGSASSLFISPRLQEEYRLNSGWSSKFGTAASSRGGVQFRRSRREYYTGTGTVPNDEREARTETSLSFIDALEYNLMENMSLDASIDISQRWIERRNTGTRATAGFSTFSGTVEEFRLRGGGGLSYQNSSGTRGSLRMEFNERDESHSIEKDPSLPDIEYARRQRIEEQKNNSILQTHLIGKFLQPLGGRDTVALAVSTVKTEYNTPSSQNTDDRDELFIAVGARWNRAFNSCFKAALSADIQMRHIVNIFGERSANNCWNRVIRLSPFVEYRLGTMLVSRFQSEVVANYTVYDFAVPTAGFSDFSLRQLALTDTTTWALSAVTALTLQAGTRYSEQGELRWSSFSLRPLAFITERWFTLAFRYAPARIILMTGVRTFFQDRSRYEGLRQYEETAVANFGPLCRLEFHFLDKGTLFVDGWFQITEQKSSPRRSTPNLSLQVLWNL